MKKNKKKKPKRHVTFNRKAFLAINSIRSMAAIHTKIKEDGTAIFRISDCNRCVRIWNDLNNREEVKEMLEKINTIREHLNEFEQQVKIKLNT